jgi:hypothetical protein
VGEGEKLGDGEAARSVVSSVFSGPLEGAGVVVVGSVRSVVCGGGSYGPLSATDSVIPTTAAASVTTGVSATTSGTRNNGRTHPSKTYHNSTATLASTAATSHHGCPKIIGPPIYLARYHPRLLLSRTLCAASSAATSPFLCGGRLDVPYGDASSGAGAFHPRQLYPELLGFAPSSLRSSHAS